MTDPIERVRSTWRQLVALGDDFPRLFYAVLFDRAPATADLFPVDMRAQRRHLLAALGQVVHAMESGELDGAALRRLGADHRRFGTAPEHYPIVGGALLATMAHLLPEWDDDPEAYAAAWGDAYGTVAGYMMEGAAAATWPAWFDCQVAEMGGTLDRLELWVTADDPTLEMFDAAPGLWLCRTDRPGHWVRGLLEGWDDPGPGVQARIGLPLSDHDLDALAIAAIPPGALVRVAPVLEETQL